MGVCVCVCAFSFESALVRGFKCPHKFPAIVNSTECRAIGCLTREHCKKS